MMPISATIEASDALQSKKPLHILTHKMALLTTDHTHSIMMTRRKIRIPPKSPTQESESTTIDGGSRRMKRNEWTKITDKVIGDENEKIYTTSHVK